MLEDDKKLYDIASRFQPEIIIHLAAQAGVRYSLENPRSYINSNIIGTFNVMEVARKIKIKHLLMASSSSVYGSNSKIPFTEIDKTDSQLTIYAASKKANESMAHSYAHLWKIPTTMFRFFTVYGPWGRPDMALFKFVSAIINNKPIDIYNNGEMYRDFTYIDDLVSGIHLLIDVIPGLTVKKKILEIDSFSQVAPYRIVNIGNSKKIKLLDFIDIIEKVIGKKAIRNYYQCKKVMHLLHGLILLSYKVLQITVQKQILKMELLILLNGTVSFIKFRIFLNLSFIFKVYIIKNNDKNIIF
jgi:UDP-glucuronate 4-epimerase